MEIVSAGLLCADVIVSPLDALPRAGTSVPADTVTLGVGGCGSNTGIVLGKLGHAVGVMGKVGRDAFGDFLVREIGRHGVDTAGITIDPSVPTTAAITFVHTSGERSFAYVPTGSCAEFGTDDIDFDRVGTVRVFHLGGVMKCSRLHDGEVFRRVKTAGVSTSLDSDWDASGRWLELVEALLPNTDIFTPNFGEAQHISGQEAPEDAAEFFLDRGVSIVAVKMGADGCYVRSRDEAYRIPACRIEPVDTCGAGDAFAAGFLAGYCRDWALRDCGRLANACGALCSTMIGTTGGITDFESTVGFMNNTAGR